MLLLLILSGCLSAETGVATQTPTTALENESTDNVEIMETIKQTEQTMEVVTQIAETTTQSATVVTEMLPQESVLRQTAVSEQEFANEDIRDILRYEELEDIISVEKIEVEQERLDWTDVVVYRICYKSDDCEVFAYLSIPEDFMGNNAKYPCMIYNRGGNREFASNKTEYIAYIAYRLNRIVFASQYRGVDGGSGQEEFGGADVHDVLKLIDICEELPFVDIENLCMMGESRGGMMTYQAVRDDNRIKKAIIGSGASDTIMSYNERGNDMKKVLVDLIGGTPEELPEEYVKRSATYWADEIKCPLLIIHSTWDGRVSFAQAEKMVEQLEKYGKEYEFIVYEDTGHGFRPEDFEIIREWYGKQQ